VREISLPVAKELLWQKRNRCWRFDTELISAIWSSSVRCCHRMD